MRKLFLYSAFALFQLAYSGVEAKELPRAEYPRPQLERDEWINLNGEWSYEFDFSKSGFDRQRFNAKNFDNSIIVPFCPESHLSGVNFRDFINAMWYQRDIAVPDNWANKRVILNFGAVDYMAVIFINGKEIFRHYGGSSSFSVDITPYVTAGGNDNLVVYVEDDLRSSLQTSGKQSHSLNSGGCHYTRVTGIWQTVWMESVSKGGLKNCRITPDLDNKQFVFEPVFYDLDQDASFKVRILNDGKEIFSKKILASDNSFIFAPIKNIKPWSPESPFLYDIEFSVLDKNGKVIDLVNSYAGMRKVELRGKELYLNNAPYYQRLVLDQGYYPDGHWTASHDSLLRKDIELSKEAGFNGARLHQKVFEQRYFYWADKLGYLTWGESASWGVDWTNPVAARNMISEWEECIHRDYNSPSLIAWSPLNETWKDDINNQRERLSNDLYFMTKRIDRTRPVITVSGGFHTGHTDIYAEHTYTQDPVHLFNQLSLNNDGYPYVAHGHRSAPYKGECYMIDEFGGIQWVTEKGSGGWGYGNAPKDEEEFYTRLEGQVNAILSLDHINGFCYTQIVDVEQEKNGVYNYDRSAKFDMKRINKIFSKSKEQAKKEMKELLKKQQ